MNSVSPQTLQAWLSSRQEAMLQRLRHWVEIESPTEDKAGIDRLGDSVAAAFAEAGAAIQRHRRSTSGDIVEARVAGASAGGPLLLLGHLDTVYPLGTLARMPFQICAGEIRGPGVMDMKGGVVQALFALLALQAHGLRPARDVLCLWTGDEETGSHASRDLIEARARDAAAVYVLEPGSGWEGALKTARKGIAAYTVKVTGRAAHAGVDFFAGASAIVELSRLILDWNGWVDRERGISLNAGVVRGGTRSNVVAAEAEVELDVRAWRGEDLNAIDRRLRTATPPTGVSLAFAGGINRPPLERTAAIGRLFEQARGLATALGLELAESATGGGSDGNFTAAIGAPTLDGLGMAGLGAHSPDERARLDRFVPRTALLAALLASAA